MIKITCCPTSLCNHSHDGNCGGDGYYVDDVDDGVDDGEDVDDGLFLERREQL